MPTAGRPAWPQVVQVSGYYPPHVGGIEYCALNISRELSRRGVQVSVLTSDLGATDAGPEPADAPPVRRLRSIEVAHTPIMPGLPWALWRESRRAVIHLHVSHIWSDVVTTLVALLGRRPLVSHFHMDTPPSGRWGFVFVLYKRLLLGWLLRRARTVIALSDEQAELLSRRYRVDAERMRIIPNGVAAEFFADVAEQMLDGGEKPEAETEPGKPLRLLFVGRLAAQKDLPLLLAAAELLGPQVTVDIAGDGELRAQITELAAALPTGRARLWGTLSGAELLTRYREADAFVMTSEREGMPLALLEAMAAGLPVVACDVQGLREFVDGVGLLVSERSAAGFAAQIRRLIEDPDLRAKLSMASVAAVQSRRWDALAGEVLDAYALASGGPIMAGLSADRAPKGQARRPQQRESHK
jgi:glycosyltransferase involved in cell wall biosynthesis